MTWAVHRKFMVSRCTFFVSFAISLVQIALIPAGIAIVKNADTDCFTRPTLTYVYTFYLSLAQCIVLVCISIPICFMPCCFLLFDLPSYHGVSPRAIQRLTTITYMDPLSDQTSTVYSSSSNTTGKPSPEEVEAIAPAASRPSWKTIFASSNRSEDLAVSEITTAQAAEPPSERPQLPQTPRAKKQNKTRNFNNNGGRGKSMGQSSRHATVHETECAICLEPWKNGEVIKQMKCGHSYHQDCLTMWLEEHNHCPYCRHQIQTNALFSRF
ncbi:hypothetical protein BDR26DRAFT_857717 [Obelidium mucronatum]|nr:hypothetical protein BDR26DRAFT_857717 [Obelidium mucronatum]